MIPNRLPNIDKNNIKFKVMEGLESKVQELGNLNVPIIFSTDYPSSQTNPTNDTDETQPYRRIIIKRINTTVANYAIGDVFASESKLDPVECETWDSPSGVDELYEVFGEGWFEGTTLEISIWCKEPEDRDNLIELIKMWVLELEHRNLPNGAPYFYNNQIYGVKFIRAYESIDIKIIQNEPFYVGALEYLFQYPVYGVTVEDFERIKVSIVGKIQDQYPDNTPIIIDTGKEPIVRPVQGGGGTDILTPDDTLIIPEPHYGILSPDDRNKETLYVGSPIKTDGGMLIEHIKHELLGEE